MLRGTPISPGTAIGRVYVLDRQETALRKVSSEEAHQDLNRFREALDRSREQIQSLKDRLRSTVGAEDLRILDVQLAYLNDPIFIDDVESRILQDHLGLEAAIDRVLWDFSRILRLVENEYLRERAQDLSDVALRVLRNVAPLEAGAARKPPGEPYVLAVRELTVTDMFHESGDMVSAVIAEEGGLTSHAAILARSMKIPTVTGIVDLLDKVSDGEEVIVDGYQGLVRPEPDEALKEEYLAAREVAAQEIPEGRGKPIQTRDGTALTVRASCGNMSEVEQAERAGLQGVGMYRTELLFLVDRETPSEDALVEHYRAAAESAGDDGIIFRLLDLQSDLRPELLHGGEREPNPALGRRSIRGLLENRAVLHVQLRAILRAAHGIPDARILVPFVLDVGDLRTIKEILYDERELMRKQGVEHAARLPVGTLLEVPAALLGIRSLVSESDFLAIGVDNLIQYLMAADRKNAALRHYYTRLHPTVLRAIAKVVRVARELDREVMALGEVVSRADLLPLFLGVGIRNFSISPVATSGFRVAAQSVTIPEARRMAGHYMKKRTSDPASVERALQARFP